MTTAPYKGGKRKLVIAFDVGTTFSGISYSILDPDQIPEIKGVTKFPGQENVSGSSKIPTILYYDAGGNVRAAGAETLSEGVFEQAEEQQWSKVEWFKLHLRPNVQGTKEITDKLPPLPAGKRAIDVLADYLSYLYRCARSYIQETHASGLDLWNSVANETHFVLSHPNGWEGIQQSQMRKAAIMAGLIPDNTAGHARVSFVTEGEASLHFAINHGLPVDATKTTDGIAIVDAGGGTIDISAYSRTNNTTRQSFEEIAQSQCHFHGSVFVTIHARMFLEELLSESDFRDDVDHIVRCFDRSTKLRFRNDQEPQYVKFGSTRDNDPSCDIRFGQLKLTGTDVATFFEPSIRCIIDAVKNMRGASHKKFTHVVLVGGFAASDWLYTKASEALQQAGYQVMRPDHYVSKAVSDGAISYYIDHYVQTRVSKLTYGTRGSVNYNSSNATHNKHLSNLFTSISGIQRISNVFWVILGTNTQIPETNEIRRNHYWEFKTTSALNSATSRLFCYRGSTHDGSFIDDDPGNYSQLCEIEVNLSHLVGTNSVETITSAVAGTYYKVTYDIIMLFGGTEIQAQVAWRENGIEKRSSAKIIYTDTLPSV